mmetsp:Transcript_11453/g.17395  ORF Transcript_11453/g.17395 Transcript_11453/m.17395 type:complete len:414 (+) Transcript_11453:325-1566(+)
MAPQISLPMGMIGEQLGMEIDPIALAWRGNMHNAPITTSPTSTITSSTFVSASPCTGLGRPRSSLAIDTTKGMGMDMDCRDDECMRRHIHKHTDPPLPPSLSDLQSSSLTSSPSRSGDADTDTDAETDVGSSMARSIHSHSDSFSGSFSGSFSPSGPGLGPDPGPGVNSRKSVSFSPETRDDVESSHSQEEVEVECNSEGCSSANPNINPFDYSFHDYVTSLFCMDSLCGSSSTITTKSTETPSKSLAERLSSCYTHGIFTYLPDTKYKKRRASHSSSSTSIDQFRGDFISQEEKQYALRWKGHLPLVPMHDSRAMEGRRRRRDKWRRARGVLVQRPGTGTGTGTAMSMDNVDEHAVSDELELESGEEGGSESGLKTLISGEGYTGDLYTESDSRSRSGSGDGEGCAFLCASP